MGQGRVWPDRLSGSLLLLGAEEGAAVARRDRPGDFAHLRKARHSAARARGAARHPEAGRRRRRGSDPQTSRAGEEISRHGGADQRQFLRHAQFGGVLRRLLRLCAAGRALPDGAVDLFPHQRAQYRPVRAHADHRRPRRLCELPRRLHRADARREPAPRRGGRAGGARRRRDQILDHPELVSGRRQRQGWRLQFRHQARRLPRQERKDFVDPAGDRLGDHLEISELHPARRQFARRVLLDRDLQRLSAGRFRHKNAASRQEHHEPHYLQGHRRRPFQQHLSRAGHRAPPRHRRAQLHQLRFAFDRRQVRRAYGALYRGQEFLDRVRARGHDVEDLRGDAVLLPAARSVGGGGDGAGGQRLRQGRAAAVADGIRGRGAEIDLGLAGRLRRLIALRRAASGKKNMALLEIRNLHVEIDGKEILKGLDLTVNAGEVHAIMGPNGSGKSTLAYVLAGKAGYEPTAGEVKFNGKNIFDMQPDERAAAGLFLAFQYPLEIPGVATMTFLRTALNAQRKKRGEAEFSTPEFLKKVREVAGKLGIEQEMLRRAVNVGFSGGEKKRNEVLQMALFEPRLGVLDETDSGLDIDALRIVSEGVNRLRSKERAFVVITHYQRLLDYIVPDVVHVLSKGRIVKTGGKDLALELEARGYAEYQEEVPA